MPSNGDSVPGSETDVPGPPEADADAVEPEGEQPSGSEAPVSVEEIVHALEDVFGTYVEKTVI